MCVCVCVWGGGVGKQNYLRSGLNRAVSAILRQQQIRGLCWDGWPCGSLHPPSRRLALITAHVNMQETSWMSAKPAATDTRHEKDCRAADTGRKAPNSQFFLTLDLWIIHFIRTTFLKEQRRRAPSKQQLEQKKKKKTLNTISRSQRTSNSSRRAPFLQESVCLPSGLWARRSSVTLSASWTLLQHKDGSVLREGTPENTTHDQTKTVSQVANSSTSPEWRLRVWGEAEISEAITGIGGD